MKIKCPDCSTSYEIKAEALGPEGRSVKCAKCGNRWYVAPKPEEEADIGQEPETEVAESTEKDEAEWAADTVEEDAADAPEPETEEPEIDEAPVAAFEAPSSVDEENYSADLEDEIEEEPGEQPADIESHAKRRKIKVNPNKFRRNHLGKIINWMLERNYKRIGGLTLLTCTLALCASLVLTRDAIVKQSPDLASLFQLIGFEVNLRGLEFRNLRTFTEVQDGKRILVVEGSIRNLQELPNVVPGVRLSVRSADLQEIYAWTIEPRTTTLNGLDETRFRTILADPPEGATDIQVRFVDRGRRKIVLE